MFQNDDDGASCGGCGCDMEVIGPPGPVHREGCPHKPAPRPEGRELTAAESDHLFSKMIGTAFGFRMFSMSQAEIQKATDQMLARFHGQR